MIGWPPLSGFTDVASGCRPQPAEDPPTKESAPASRKDKVKGSIINKGFAVRAACLPAACLSACLVSNHRWTVLH
jgi:hypothetical protein